MIVFNHIRNIVFVDIVDDTFHDILQKTRKVQVEL